MRQPSLRLALGGSLYMQAPPQLEEALRPNLQKSLKELISTDATVIVTDPALPVPVRLRLYY